MSKLVLKSFLHRSFTGRSYLVVDRVPVFVVRKDELLLLQDQEVRGQLEPRRLGPAFAVTHRHEPVVNLLGLEDMAFC